MSIFGKKQGQDFAFYNLWLEAQENTSLEGMTDTEAIRLLMECYTLAKRLESINLKLELSLSERKALAGFERVRQAGYVYGKLTRLAVFAGLNSGDLGMLNWYCNLLTDTRQAGLSA